MIAIAIPTHKRDITKLLKSIRDQDSNVYIYQSQDDGVGLVNNTYKAINDCFLQGYEWVLYLEDDLEIAPDTLELISWYLKQKKTNMLCLCNLDSGDNENAIITRSEMIGWGFLIHESVYQLIEPYWKTPPMWDLSVSRFLNGTGHKYYYPEVSRIRHTGVDGSHVIGDTMNNDLQSKLKFATNINNNYYFKNQ
jgi:hypothetical protein